MLEKVFRIILKFEDKVNKNEDEVYLLEAAKRFATAFLLHQEALLIKAKRAITNELDTSEESSPYKAA